MPGPDYADYVPATVPLPLTLVLQPMTAAIPGNYTTPDYDVSRVNTLNLALVVIGVATLDLLEVVVTWSVGGQVVASDAYCCFNGNPTASASSQTYFQLPCKGDTVSLQFNGSAAPPSFQYELVGTTRVLPGPNITNGVNQDALTPLFAASAVLGGNITESFFVGPFSKGVWVYLETNASTVNVNVTHYTLDSGNWVNARDALVTVTGAQGTQLQVPVAGRALRIFVSNRTATACTIYYTVIEIP